MKVWDYSSSLSCSLHFSLLLTFNMLGSRYGSGSKIQDLSIKFLNIFFWVFNDSRFFHCGYNIDVPHFWMWGGLQLHFYTWKCRVCGSWGGKRQITILAFCMTHQNGRTPNTFSDLKLANYESFAGQNCDNITKLQGEPMLAPHATPITLFFLACFNLCDCVYIENCAHCSNHLKFELSVKEEEQWLTDAMLDQLACLPDHILPLSKSKKSLTSSEHWRHHLHQHWWKSPMAYPDWKSCTIAWMSFLVCHPPNKPFPSINMKNGSMNCWMDL